MKKLLFIALVLFVGCQKEEIKPSFDYKVVDFTFNNLYWAVQYVVESNVNDSIFINFDFTCFNKDSIYHKSFTDQQKAIAGLNVYKRQVPITDKLSKVTICSIDTH